jgi:hypothetical protein
MLVQLSMQNCTILHSFVMHATYGQKADRVYFHIQQTARHFDFPLGSYDSISGNCSGDQQSRETTSGTHLMVTFHVAYL